MLNNAKPEAKINIYNFKERNSLILGHAHLRRHMECFSSAVVCCCRILSLREGGIFGARCGHTHAILWKLIKNDDFLQSSINYYDQVQAVYIHNFQQ